MDGPWQIGHKTVEEYARLAEETAKVMKLVDPDISLVACGSSGWHIPTFGEWEATVLEHTYDYVDYISLHAYYDNYEDNIENFLAKSIDMDSYINRLLRLVITSRVRKKVKRRLIYHLMNGMFGFIQEKLIKKSRAVANCSSFT